MLSPSTPAGISSLAGNDSGETVVSRREASTGRQHQTLCQHSLTRVPEASASETAGSCPYPATATHTQAQQVAFALTVNEKCRYNKSHCGTIEAVKPPRWPTSELAWRWGEPSGVLKSLRVGYDRIRPWFPKWHMIWKGDWTVKAAHKRLS